MDILTEFGTLAALFIRIISVVVIVAFCIPLQVREVQVYNGLRRLRILLLLSGLILLLTDFVTIVILFNVIRDQIYQTTFNISLQVFNAIGFLVLSYIGYLIYHQQYTEESKEAHRITEKVMRGECKVVETKKGGVANGSRNSK